MSQEKMRVLKDLIHEKGKTIKGFSNELGIAESTFYRKVDGKEYGFTIREAQRIAELLALTKEEAGFLFF